MPWSFQVILPPSGGVEFAPGEFAAESEAHETPCHETGEVLGRRCGTAG